MKLQTERLDLTLQSPSEVLQWVETLPPETRQEISEDWLSRLRQATGPDPWSCMFSIIAKTSGASIGSCGFKGPPDELGMVEIAYGIDEPYRCCGYATESVRALVDFTATLDDVTTVRASTNGKNPASERVLSKLGFRLLGQFEDPEDGLVNRWERGPSINAS